MNKKKWEFEHIYWIYGDEEFGVKNVGYFIRYNKMDSK